MIGDRNIVGGVEGGMRIEGEVVDIDACGEEIVDGGKVI